MRWLVATALGLAIVAGSVTPVGATDAVPYVDRGVTGSLGLCDVHGNPVLAGKITDKPFVWLAVGATRVPAPYDAPGRTAFLAAFQPRKGIDPAEWNGFPLASASRYSNVAHPMSQATPLSSPLQDFLGRYPAQWEGLVQLRLLVSGSNLSARTDSYDATDLRITGDTWQVVRGASVGCRTGTAVSSSVLLRLPGAAGTPKPGAVAPAPSVDRSTVAEQVVRGRSGNPSVVGTSPSTSSRAGATTAARPSASSSTVTSPSLLPLALAGGAAVVFTGLLVLLARRRRTAS